MAETLEQEKKEAGSEAASVRRRSGKVRLMVPILLAALAVGGYFAWGYFSSYESTDDAQVDGHVNSISARINGHVTEVLVEDAQYVKAGDVLVKIDPRDYEVAVAKAEADVADAEASVMSSQTDVPITSVTAESALKGAHSTKADASAALLSAERQLNASHARLAAVQAQVAEAEAEYKKAADDVGRYGQLVAKEEVSQQQYDQAVQTAAAAKAAWNAREASLQEAQQNVKVAEAAIEQARARISQAEATVQQAMTGPQQVAVSRARLKSAEAKLLEKKAALEQARLNLSYTTIVAPVSGVVGKKTVEVGQNISPGQQLLAVVPLDDIWITANFKETQLRQMKAGQRVKFSVDAFGREYSGHVTGIGGASGSRFSLLPPENATGNYVKVVQRIPVRIDLDPGQNADHRLRPGMSVVPKVYLQ
jgi:membrane fusion protein (multidrug efflux system)